LISLFLFILVDFFLVTFFLVVGILQYYHKYEELTE
jgi:hypothetical protein